MAILTSTIRNMMPKASFALPGERFPINDPTHARLAIGGATRALKAGNITPKQAVAIKMKAKRKLV